MRERGTAERRTDGERDNETETVRKRTYRKSDRLSGQRVGLKHRERAR